ncbi:Pumilio domain-containing protein KIAA0020 [Acipenser ruthenus]|uniref:Pumilio domain-containing protein KIAA0020 n=1 Tax=Acipenser ruthenus TaxID=7906 RepID=A0A444V7I2_ACIRT|nr:Pumilio domain-containing protein KIAA0020 [Acipenser ruthenus]
MGGKGGMKKFTGKKQSDKFTKKRKPQQEQDEEGSAAKKPKWDEFKKNKKELKQNRQQNERKNSYYIINRSKQVWEAVRRKDCDKEKRLKLMSELQELLRGKIKSIAFAHDSTRVLQCYIQFGNDQQRQEVFDELKEHLVELSKSKYARNIVKKFLMYGNKQQVSEVMNSFKGQVRKMLRHAEACTVVEFAYNDKAILEQRLMLTEELYGNTFQLCKSAICPTLDKVLESNPEKQASIMEEMKQILTSMAHKEAVVKHSLVHKVILDFFIHASAKLKSEIISSLPIILNNKYGKKVLLYLLNPRDPAHFLPEIIKVLQQGDGNAYSKKDVHTRQHELLEAISPPVLQHLQENAREVVMDKATSVVVADILGSAVGDLQPAMDSVADLAAEEFVPGGKGGQLHLAEHPAGHLVLKWLIAQDFKMKELGKKGNV